MSPYCETRSCPYFAYLHNLNQMSKCKLQYEDLYVKDVIAGGGWISISACVFSNKLGKRSYEYKSNVYDYSGDYSAFGCSFLAIIDHYSCDLKFLA